MTGLEQASTRPLPPGVDEARFATYMPYGADMGMQCGGILSPGKQGIWPAALRNGRRE